MNEWKQWLIDIIGVTCLTLVVYLIFAYSDVIEAVLL